MNKTKRCPRCLRDEMDEILETAALSRRDNKTHICSGCGTEEAMIDAGLIEDEFVLGVDKIFVLSLK